MNKITITLNTGCRITLNQPEKLCDCEKDKKVSWYLIMAKSIQDCLLDFMRKMMRTTSY